MNKFQVLSITFTSFFLITVSTSAQVKFLQSDLEVALREAKINEKKIFIDVYTKWCGPCKRMDKEVFSGPEVDAYMHEHFIPLKANAESKFGGQIARKYDVQAYPTLIIADSIGQLHSMKIGSFDKEGFLNFLSNGLLMETSFEKVEEEYKKGNRDYEFIFSYLKLLKDSGQYDKGNKVLKRFLKGKDWTKGEHLDLIFHYGMGQQNLSYLKFFSKNEDVFQQRFDSLEIERKVFSFSLALLKIHSHDYSFKELRRKMKKLWIEKGEKRYLYFIINFRAIYSRNPDPAIVANELYNYVFRHHGGDRDFIINTINIIVLNTKKQITLKAIDQILKHLKEQESTIEIIDLQAVVAFNGGKEEESISFIKEARQLAYLKGKKYISTVQILRSNLKKKNQSLGKE